MYKYALIFIAIFSISYAQDDCSEIQNSFECVEVGCEWLVTYQQIGNELVLIEECYGSSDNEQSCSDINNLYECFALGCNWVSGNMPGAGYCEEFDSDDEENDNQDEEDGPPECLLDCEGIEYINPEENPYETCDWVISNFGPNNFFNECAEDCDNETMMEINEYMELCLQCLADNNCDDAFDVEDDNDWNEDECRYFESEDECIASGCQWGDDGCFSSLDNDNEDYCEGLNEEECFDTEGCQWYDDEGCYRSEDNNEDEDCDSSLMCGSAVTCWDDGLLYPTICGPENCDEPIGECDDNHDNDWDDNENYCEGLTEDECFEAEGCQWYDGEGCYRFEDDEDNQFDSCSDIENLEECENIAGCEWMYSNNMPGYGSCIDSEWENDDCDPNLACGDMITCWEDGLLYPTTCGPENCDEPIGECDDSHDDIDSCEGLAYNECMNFDFCEWVESNNSINSGYCTDSDNDENDDLPECFMDCDGVLEVDPVYEATYFCEWLLNVFPTGCAEDCNQDILDEIEEWMIACDECLSNNNCEEDNQINDCSNITNPEECEMSENCEWSYNNMSGAFGACVEVDMDIDCSQLTLDECFLEPDCSPNFNAVGEFESCNNLNQNSYGTLYGQIEFIYGDAIASVPYAQISIESLPSNNNMISMELVSNAEGFYSVDLPFGLYIVTAFANGESLSQDIMINQSFDYELNFLLGEWDGPNPSFSELSLGENISVAPNSNFTIPLYLSSDELVGGFQFNISMDPALNFESIESTFDCFTANYNTVQDEIIVIIFSLEGCAFPAEQMLHVADMEFFISPYFEIGNLAQINFTNTIVSSSAGIEIPSIGLGIEIMVGMQGDVNFDTEINVIDVVTIVSFALQNEVPNDQQFWASDINNDNFINVLDVVMLVNQILDF